MNAERADPARSRPGPGALLDRDWIFALALAFAVGVVVWFAHAIKDFIAPSVATVAMPSFVGETEDDVQGDCARLGIRCVVLERRTSDRYPKGTVMAQKPSSGTPVRAGRQVSLIVSSGVTIIPMPDLRFESVRNAALDLNRLKLRLTKTRSVADDDVPSGYVVSQDPIPTISVREGTAVSLVLSKGPPPAVKVPDFRGMSIDDARSLAADKKVHLGQIVWTPFGAGGPPRGEVVAQKPEANREIPPFDMVSLQVSDGPGQYGYLLRQVHVATTVPARDEAANVRIALTDQTGTWNVYDGFAQGGQKLDFTVTAVGTAEIDTYVDNELLNHTTIGKEPPTPSPGPSGGPKVR